MRFWKDTRSTDGGARLSADADTAAAVREAYARGRRDERARHRRSPLMVSAFTLAALMGGAMLISAAMRGSFEGGGQLIDNQIATAAQEAKPALRGAAHEATRAIQGGRAEVASGG